MAGAHQFWDGALFLRFIRSPLQGSESLFRLHPGLREYAPPWNTKVPKLVFSATFYAASFISSLTAIAFAPNSAVVISRPFSLSM